jgi:hypothetical protein
MVAPSVREQMSKHDLRHAGTRSLPFLQLLDHVGVLRHARHVVDDADAVLRGQRANGFQVGERDRLPTGHVHRGGDD